MMVRACGGGSGCPAARYARNRYLDVNEAKHNYAVDEVGAVGSGMDGAVARTPVARPARRSASSRQVTRTSLSSTSLPVRILMWTLGVSWCPRQLGPRCRASDSEAVVADFVLRVCVSSSTQARHHWRAATVGVCEAAVAVTPCGEFGINVNLSQARPSTSSSGAAVTLPDSGWQSIRSTPPPDDATVCDGLVVQSHRCSVSHVRTCARACHSGWPGRVWPTRGASVE